MPTPSYETPSLRKWNTYRRVLRSGPAKPILDAYSRAGGDAGHLRGVLWRSLQDKPKHYPDRRTLQAMQRLLRGLEAIPDMEALKDIDSQLWDLLNGLTDVTPVLEAFLREMRDLPMTTRQLLAPFRSMARKAGVTFEESIPDALKEAVREARKQSPRRRGQRAETLTAAALVEEFKRRKMQSRYLKAATLLYEASPNLFPDLNDEDKADRLGRLVRSVPEKIRKRERARLFPSSLSF